MDRDSLNPHLTQISTLWGALSQSDAASLGALLQRYSGAVYRYLLGAVRDEDVAQELTQELALRFLRGDFHRADPQRATLPDRRFRLARLRSVL